MGKTTKLTAAATTLAKKLVEIASFARPPRPEWK